MITRHAVFGWERNRFCFTRADFSFSAVLLTSQLLNHLTFPTSFSAFQLVLGNHQLTGTAPVADAGGAHRVELDIVDLTWGQTVKRVACRSRFALASQIQSERKPKLRANCRKRPLNRGLPSAAPPQLKT